MRELKGDQPVAFDEIKSFIRSSQRLWLLQGYAGTGKTYLLDDIVYYLGTLAIKLLITAPTHKAVKVLKSLIHKDVNFSTIHAALGMKEVIQEDGSVKFVAESKFGYPAEVYDFIVVDEASMLDDSIFEELINLSERGKKILFVGDPAQIPPVNHEFAKPFLKEVQEDYQIGVSTLNTIIRQAEGNPIVSYASNIRKNLHARSQIFNCEGL